MTTPLTDAELTILGLLVEQPRHGYDLERVIDERGVRNWTALGFSSIYYLLDKLATRGLIEAVEPVRAGKSRAPYRATAQGRAVCAASSLEAIATLTPLRVRALIGIANSPGLAGEDVVDRLGQRAQTLQATLAEVRAARARQEPLPIAAAAIFDYGEAMLVADLEWTRTTRAAITGRHSDGQLRPEEDS